MERIIKILKINILSIVAIPLLLIASIAKMIERVFEKIKVVAAVIIIILGVMFLAEIIKQPEDFLQLIIMLFIIAGFAAIIFGIIGLMLTIGATVLAVIYGTVVVVLNFIYEITYSGFQRIFDICEYDYTYLSLENNTIINDICCIFYTLLKLINKVIDFMMSAAFVLSIILSIIITIYSLVSFNKVVQTNLGIGMIKYVQKFSIFTIIYSILVYLIVMIGIITILVSIGYEWREWSKNIKISTEDYEKCINSFRKDTAAIDETEYDTNVNEEEAFKYFSILTMHLNELEKFGKETIDILEKGSNPILNSTWNEYMGIINQLNENVLSFDKIPAYVVEKNIPLIKQLDKIKEEIIKLSEKQKETIKNSTVSSMFFKGCNTKEKLEKRYKSLCKTYHPDVESGDEDIFKQIQEEYEKMKNA